MSDEENFDDKDQVEEEFDFLEDDEFVSDDGFDAAGPPPSVGVTSATSTKKSPLNKNIIVGLAVIVSLAGGAFFYATQQKNKKKMLTPAPKVEAQVEDVIKPLEVEKPFELSEQPIKSEDYDISSIKTEIFDDLLEESKGDKEVVEELKNSLSKMNNDIKSNINQIKRLHYSLNEVSKAIKALDNNINILDSKILGISDSVSKTTKDITKIQKIIVEEDLDLTSQKAINETITYAVPEYTVHAVIPGRAWLKDVDGKIITVTEGDSLGKYGQIAVIDVINSIVSTSSGTSFR